MRRRLVCEKRKRLRGGGGGVRATGKKDEEGEVDEMTGEIRRAYGKRSEKDVNVTVNGEKLTMHVFEVLPEDDDVRQRGREGVENVVCLHSVLTSSYIYRGVLPLLAKEGMRAIAIDAIGHGQSSSPAGDAGFDFLHLSPASKARRRATTSGCMQSAAERQVSQMGKLVA